MTILSSESLGGKGRVSCFGTKRVGSGPRRGWKKVPSPLLPHCAPTCLHWTFHELVFISAIRSLANKWRWWFACLQRACTGSWDVWLGASLCSVAKPRLKGWGGLGGRGLPTPSPGAVRPGGADSSCRLRPLSPAQRWDVVTSSSLHPAPLPISPSPSAVSLPSSTCSSPRQNSAQVSPSHFPGWGLRPFSRSLGKVGTFSSGISASFLFMPPQVWLVDSCLCLPLSSVSFMETKVRVYSWWCSLLTADTHCLFVE